MAKYFLICTSKDHVPKGVEGSVAQAGMEEKALLTNHPKVIGWFVIL